jgi:hypothetical protein
MSRPSKLLLGVVSLWPLLYLLFFFGFFVFTAVNAVTSPPPAPVFQTQTSANDGMPVGFAVLVVFHVLTALMLMALLIIYIRDVFKNNRVERTKRRCGRLFFLWAAGLPFRFTGTCTFGRRDRHSRPSAMPGDRRSSGSGRLGRRATEGPRQGGPL